MIYVDWKREDPHPRPTLKMVKADIDTHVEAVRGIMKNLSRNLSLDMPDLSTEAQRSARAYLYEQLTDAITSVEAVRLGKEMSETNNDNTSKKE